MDPAPAAPTGIGPDLHDLALRYLPAGKRPAVDALFALDATLAGILRHTREPIVGQMRLTWWHDALTRLDPAAPPAEPVLTDLARHVVPEGVAPATLAAMIDGWEVLLGTDALSDDELARFAGARGSGLFRAIARVCGAVAGDPVAAAGAGWALADLARHVRDPALAARARAMAAPPLAEAMAARWSGGGRALGALAHIAARPDPGPGMVLRLFWHSLTGR